MKIGRAIFARDFFLMENEVFDQLLHPAITNAAALCVIFTIFVSFSQDNALFASKASGPLRSKNFKQR